MLKGKDDISSVILWVSIRTVINMIFLFALVEGFVSAYHFSYKLFADVPYMASSPETKNITIQSGADAEEIASLLDELGMVDGKYLFLARIYLGKYNTKIVAGTYTLGPGMTPDEICRKICGMQSEGMS